jgi:glycosyltransferase involved in cell wall biosynthesis
MRVAFDAGPLRPRPAGVGIYVRSLAQGLDAIGRRDVGYIGVRPDAEGLPAGVASMWRRPGFPYPLWVELLAPRDVARARAEIVHFTDGLVPLIRSRPTLVTVLDLSLVRHWRAHRWIRYARIPFVLAAPRLADRVIAISRATADEIIRLTGTPARKIEVIHLAPRVDLGPAGAREITATLLRLGLTGHGYLLAPGTIEPRKNHRRVITAFERLVAGSALPQDMFLVLAGSPGWGSSATMRAIAESPVRDRISVLGYVPEADLAALMTAAAAVVYASTYEGFGLPIIEAMACGAPVVTSAVSSMPEVAGDAGILVDPFDPASIAAGIATALHADDAVRARARKQAGRFSWAATAAATAAQYDALG